MKLHKKILLALLVCSISSSNIQAHASDDLAMSMAKSTAGAVIGGGLFYWLSGFSQADLVAEHENKMKFLDDLILFVQSPEYAQGDSSRLFTHYYNGLNQLAQTTRGVEVDLLHEFSNSRSNQDRESMLHKIQKIQSQLQTTHESNIRIGTIFLTAFGAILGGSIPFMGNDHASSCGCSHHHHSTTYVGNFARTATPNIFSRK